MLCKPAAGNGGHKMSRYSWFTVYVIAGREYDSNVIRDIGVFGFKTSKSERILYRNREKDFMEAIRIAFDRVIV